MNILKKTSILTALFAFIVGVSFTTSQAQVQDAKTDSATYKLDGKVVDSESTEVIAEAKVTIVGADVKAMTDSEGKFKLEDLPAGKHTLKVEAEGYQTWEKEMKLQQNSQVTVKLKPEPMK